MVAKTALTEGLEPVVNDTTPLISVPVTETAEGDVPAPVDAAILKAPELPLICLAVISFVVTISPDVFTLTILVLPSWMVLAADVDAPDPITAELDTSPMTLALKPIAVLLLPVEIEESVLNPIAVFLIPVVLLASAELPMAVF